MINSGFFVNYSITESILDDKNTFFVGSQPDFDVDIYWNEVLEVYLYSVDDYRVVLSIDLCNYDS
jgi:hypothetical protein